MKDLYKEGKVFEKTEVWAEGLDRWMNLSTVAQFRWTVCNRDLAANASPSSPGGDSTQALATPLYNLTELSVIVLDTVS